MRILCFGDSNTYGFIPNNFKRYDENTRWTGLLKKLTNNNIIEAGCNGRTCGFDNKSGKNETGYLAIQKYDTESFDLIIISLGINDLQYQFKASEDDLKNGLKKLFKNINNKNVLILIPTEINEVILQSWFSSLFNKDSIELSKKLPFIYKDFATENNYDYIMLKDIITINSNDGLHYTENDHRIIAEHIATYIKENYNDNRTNY